MPIKQPVRVLGMLMLTKNERFIKWRGQKADSEHKYIKSALLVNKYVHSVKQLETIKIEFSSLHSKYYLKFNKYDRRAHGVLLFCKLEIEEALDQIPESSVTERKLLTDLDNILEHFYHNSRNNIAERIDLLIASAKQLLELNEDQFVDKKQAKRLCFDLYTFLSIGNLALNNLNMAQRLFVNTVVNLDKVKQEVTLLLRMTEKKVEQLDKLLLREQIPQQKKPAPLKKTLQEYFNQRYLALMNGKSEAHDLHALEKNLDEVTKDLHRLIIKRKKKNEVILKIKKIQDLFNVLDNNDKKIRGREYLLDLIDANKDSFNALMNQSNSSKKRLLNAKIEQLKNPDFYQNLSSKILYGMSWASSMMAEAYRYYAPPEMQQASAKIFSTLDSECKLELKELTLECLFTLNEKLDDTNKEIDKLTCHLSRGDKEFNNLLANESVEGLGLLLKANNAVKDALRDYKRIAKSLEDTVLYLNIIGESNDGLTAFIQTHDGFFVRLSNFFADIWSIFKSDTAAMIDSAREMQGQLSEFELIYKKELADGMNAIKNNPDINQVIKDRFKHKIQIDLTKQREMFVGSSPSKEDVRYLIYNLKKLFNGKPVTDLPEQNPSIQGMSLVPN